jgi:hypothetical protein
MGAGGIGSKIHRLDEVRFGLGVAGVRPAIVGIA